LIVDKFDIAAQLYTTQRLENSQLISKSISTASNTSTIYGVAKANSKNGIVDVYISDDTTYSSYDINEEGTVSIPTNVYVSAGDKVMITLVGTGVTKHPVVTGVIGRGDETNTKLLELEADTGKFRNLIITDQNGTTEIDGSKIKTGSIEARSINSDVADFNQIKSDSATLKSLVVDDGSGSTAINGDKIKTGTIDGNKIKAGSISTDKLDTDVVTADELNSNNAVIKNLINEKASIQDLKVTNGNIDKLNADYASFKKTTTDNLNVGWATVQELAADQASFKNTTTDNLDVVNANIKKLDTDKLNVTDAAAKYANIDFANIGEAAIKAFYAKSGVIDDVVISDGHVTGKLVGVTIKGDLIEGGTVVADKLVMLGEDGLYYKLNTNGKTVSSEQTEYNSLNGSIITAKSITAEKVNVNDLVAFGATIGGLNISNGSLYSGAKSAVSNTTNGVYMDSEGQFALGDASHFLKFYKDTSGKWKLVISADAMTLGTGGSVEDAINESAKTVTLQYYRSTSATSLVGGSWADSSPDWVDGTYIWTRSKSVDRAGNATYSEPACITGNTGPQGKQGIQGVKGADGTNGAPGSDGVGISSVTITYGVSASSSTRPTTWQTTVPNVPQGQYLWTQTVTDYTSSSVPDTVTYTYALQGKDGAKGATGSPGAKGDPGTPGTSVKVSSIQYQVGTSGTTPPTGTWSSSVLATSTGQFLWTKTTFSDGNIAYGVAAHGAKGDKGATGATGNGISSVTVTYGVSASSSTQPSSWQSTVPTVPQGQYLWTRTITDYTDPSASDTVSYTYTLQGKDGAKGATGSPGAKGDPGTSVKVSSIQYQVGSSGTTPPTGTWSSSVLATSTGQFLWTKTTFSDGKVAYGVAAHGAKGDKGATGATGNGISSVTITYGVSSSASTHPSSWQSTLPTVPQGQYLWTRTITDYTDASVADTVSYTYALQGKDGAKGATGNAGSPGKDGTSVTVSSIQYQVGTSPTTAPTGTWSNSVLATSTGQYLWTKTTFSDGNVAYGVAAHGSTGPQGPKGTDGKSPTVSISKSGTTTTITVHNADGSTSTQTVEDGTNGTSGAKGADGRTQYLHVKYSNDDGATFTSNSGETVGSYIGTCTDFNEADPTTVSAYKWARIKGDTGAKGDPGEKGATGATGVGVSDTTVTYQSGSSGTAIPTGTWSSSIPSVPEGSFLWTRIVYSYSNGTSTTAYSVGKMGATGATGAPGADGRGVKSSSVTYQTSNSQTSIPTGSWETSVPKLSSATPYLWTRTILTYTDNTSTTAYSVGTTLDGVNVGGRNLLKNTDYEEHQLVLDSAGNGTIYIQNIAPSGSRAIVPYGSAYRCSIDVYFSDGGKVDVDINNYFINDDPPSDANNNDNDKWGSRTNTNFTDLQADKWTRIYWGSSNINDAKNPNKLSMYIADTIRFTASSATSTVKYRCLKAELGNTATDWSPAPEDVATDIAEAADKAGDALDKANANEEKLKEVSKALLSVEENIKALVTGTNGSSLMTQTTNGWTFDISKIQQTVSDSANAIANLNTNLDSTNSLLDKTRDLLNDVTAKTAYINFATDDSGNPCIELGKNDNPFKLRITNTSMDFMQGSQRIAYLSNHQLYIESSVITDSIYIGNDHTYIWKKRANNHLGLRYV
jgi:hypothetical protein